MFPVAKDQGKHQLTQIIYRESLKPTQTKSSTDIQREIQEKLKVTLSKLFRDVWWKPLLAKSQSKRRIEFARSHCIIGQQISGSLCFGTMKQRLIVLVRMVEGMLEGTLIQTVHYGMRMFVLE